MKPTRRGFLAGTATAGLAISSSSSRAADDRPALLGGEPVRTSAFPSWPRMDALEDRSLLEVLRSGHWYRGSGKKVGEFESAYARLTGAKHCVATANGTSALIAALAALDIGPGDEVIVPPYTFIATINAVLMHHALPVFVDTDRETFQIDARKIEAAITDRTAAIIPVHLGGNAADLDTILSVAGKHKIPVLEDACQAHLAEWRGRKVGTLGAAGCFSFQVSKNLSSGEGGAVLSNDDALAERTYAFHNNGRGRGGSSFQYVGGRGANLRLTEFQGALLLAQMTRLEEQSRTRGENAGYLTSLLNEIPGIRPAKMYEGCTRNAYHLYMFRYDPTAFDGLTRAKFVRALNAEGIPCSTGYTPLHKDAGIREALASKGLRRIYPAAQLDGWVEKNACPENQALCSEAIWFTQPMFLGPKTDMDEIAAAVRKIGKHAAALAKA